MNYVIDLSREARLALKRMRAFDKRPVEAAIKGLAIDPRPKKSILLTRQYKGLGIRRYTVGKWRIIYKIDEIDKIVFIREVRLKTGPETYDNLDTN